MSYWVIWCKKMKSRKAKPKATSKIDNEYLVSTLKAGTNDALEEIIRRYGDSVYSAAYQITRNHSESEEVFQDVFLTVYNKINNLKKFHALSAWIHRITINFAKQKIRVRLKNQVLLNKMGTMQDYNEQVNELNAIPGPATNLLKEEVKKVIEEAIDELPTKYKNVILLNDMHNFSLEKSSDILNISLPALKSRLHRARKKLKRTLDMYFKEEIQ